MPHATPAVGQSLAMEESQLLFFVKSEIQNDVCGNGAAALPQEFANET